MTAALKYLSRMTDEIFATQMQHAARRISDRQHMVHRRARQWFADGSDACLL